MRGLRRAAKGSRRPDAVEEPPEEPDVEVARFADRHALVADDETPSCTCGEWPAQDPPVEHTEHVLRAAASDPAAAPALARSLRTTQLTRELVRRPGGVRAMLEALVEVEVLGFPNAEPVPLGDGVLRHAWVADRSPTEGR